MKVLQTFIGCKNCGKKKNANYKAGAKSVEVVCFCGTVLKKNIK